MEVKIYCTNSRHKFPIVANLIKLFQRTDFSHMAIELMDTLMIDATGEGVKLHGKDFWNKHTPYVWFTFSIDATSVEVMEWAKSLQGRKYGYAQVFGLWLRTLGIIKANPFGRDEHRIICNELVILFLERFKGIKIKDSDNYDLRQTFKMLRGIKC